MTKVPRCPVCDNGRTNRMSIRKVTYEDGKKKARAKITKYFYCEYCDLAFIPQA